MTKRSREKANVKAKARRKNRTSLSSSLIVAIILVALVTSLALVTSTGGDLPPDPPSCTIIVVADPTQVPSDGFSRSRITATVINGTQGANHTVSFSIQSQPAGCGASLTNSSYQILFYSDTNRNAYTELIAGTEPGNVTIKANLPSIGKNNTTTVVLVLPPRITDWYNNKTKDDALAVQINESECVYFSASPDHLIDVWRWYVNDVNQGLNFDEFTYCGWAVNGTYTVKVNATNANGSTNTVTWTVTVNDITPPEKVTGLTNSTPTFSSVDLWWAANPELDVVGYKVYQDGGLLDTTSQTYYNVTGLSPVTTYEFNVSALDDNDLEGETATVSITTTPYPAPMVIDWFNNKTGDNALPLTINESECVYFDATADQPIGEWRWYVNEVNQGLNFDEFTYCGWLVNGTYTVRVNATNVNGSTNTVAWTVTVNDITPPVQVTGLTNGTPTYTTVDLWWDASAEFDVVGYKVYQDGTLLDTTSQTYYNVTGLSSGTTYEFTVSAYDDNDLEGEPATVKVTTSGSSIFDTGGSERSYPSIAGVHNGTITPKQPITVSKIFTYSCAGTGGHSEYVRIWNNTGLNVTAYWSGYGEDWHNLSFNKTFRLEGDQTYYYTIKTGSYPQIIHEPSFNATGGRITCTEFTDVNGKTHTNWIPAIRLSQ